jgi:uncharacterized alkaline shock family protein YloU
MESTTGNDDGYSVSFSAEAIEELVRAHLRQREDVKVRGPRGVEARQEDTKVFIELRLSVRESQDVVALATELQKALFDEMVAATGIEPARIDIHIERLIGG